VNLGPVRKRGADHFLGAHFSQSAQVLPESAQHFMVQDGLAAQHFLQEAQPVNKVAAPTRAAHRTRSFAVFIVGVFLAALSHHQVTGAAMSEL